MRSLSFSVKSSLFLMILLALAGISPLHAQDLKVEDVIAKHLESLGSKSKREDIKNRIAAGASSFESKLPARQTGGKAIIVSDPANLFFLTSFSSQDYPFEKIGYFSDKVSLPYTIAGSSSRSPLGTFLVNHDKILTEGLFGGSISSLWAMQSPKGKLVMAGKKKIDGRETYALNYFPKIIESDFYIKLYFDTQNFQHVRTEYGYATNPPLNAMGAMGRQAAVRTTITETFGEYKDVGGLVLPHSYKINYITDGNPTLEFNWEIVVSQYVFNQKLDPGFFNFEKGDK